jgi:hypothetical protein
MMKKIIAANTSDAINAPIEWDENKIIKGRTKGIPLIRLR